MRSKLQLSISVSSNPRTWPLLDGSVTVDGIDLVVTPLHPSEMFWRQLKFGDFDISEMSLSSLMMAIAHGDDRFVGIPVFTTHHFFHTGILVRRDADIRSPVDLSGKRVAIPEYQQTAALWIRGALAHEWGVAPEQMEWWMERLPSHSHAGATGFKPPAGVPIHAIPAEKNIGTMLVSGEIDAALFYLNDRNLVDRSTTDLCSHPSARPLFADRISEGIRYYRKTGIYPINHTMVVKRSLVEKQPWVVLNVLKAFNAANATADRQRREHIVDHVAVGAIAASAVAEVARPIVRHGVAANRTILEACAEYSFEQGLTPRRMRLEEIFAPSTLGQ